MGCSATIPTPPLLPADEPAPRAPGEAASTGHDAPPEPPSSKQIEDHLATVRLGLASSLFVALRMKHADTASHSLRVALNAAAWMLAADMSEEQRDVMEVAALLHDVGKIGVPDSILLKPGKLNANEARIMDQHRMLGVDILRRSCNSQAILDVVGASAAWFDGSNGRVPLSGEEIPLGARMLAICDAFDAMTSDQVYRSALPRERALAELFSHAGSQFDPQLVELFAALWDGDLGSLQEEAARRWLQTVSGAGSDPLWGMNAEAAAPARAELIPEEKFRQRLLDNMRDAVVFVDASLRILAWNSGAERMTGMASSSVYQRPFAPRLLDMRSDEGRPLREEDCPVLAAVLSGEIRIRRLTIRGRGEQAMRVEAQVVPVGESDGTVHGAAVLLHDVSPEQSLEARCQSLHEAATKDPLTAVANRAEFNRVHQMFVMAHLERKLPCSLIIADIDHFKGVNDTYGHQAGDEVLKAFSALLRSSCRPGDLVARYGGEEFVILCADCNNAAAARRAEGIRRAFSQMPHDCLGGHCVTCSFGATEIQPGDTPDTMLKRADRALYEAKETGRNRVVQLGTGLEAGQAEGELKPDPSSKKLLTEQDLISMVPMSIAIEKMRGFVADHQAEIDSVDEHDVRLKFGSASFFRRHADRRVPLVIELSFSNQPAEDGGSGTLVHVRVLLQRSRDRRHVDAMDRARQLLASLKSYLMASEVEEPVTLPRDEA